ncbi:MAG: phosphatidylserine/phosphatidylglycerophosphate/cardiolipin synthase family protein [Cyanobacteria bacterium J06623_7]
MSIQLKVDSTEFWTSLKQDIAEAKDYVYVQTLSFEGDRAGRGLADALLASEVTDKRIAVDSFSRVIINDKFINAPTHIFDRQLHQEVADTAQMMSDLAAGGVSVTYTNPLGLLLNKILARNHKKLIVIDDRLTYIGGINFSEHNFEWHDLMIRLDDPIIAKFAKQDFLNTWTNQDFAGVHKFNLADFYMFDGRHNQPIWDEVFKLLDRAETEVVIQSPYFTFPFYEKIGQLTERGVKVTYITPESNNRKIFDSYNRWECQQHDINLRLYQGRMTHLKSILIDDRYLLLGSANFDFVSYYFDAEIVAVIQDSQVIEEFKRRIIDVDLPNTIPHQERVPNWKGKSLKFVLQRILQLAQTLDAWGRDRRQPQMERQKVPSTE